MTCKRCNGSGQFEGRACYLCNGQGEMRKVMPLRGQQLILLQWNKHCCCMYCKQELRDSEIYIHGQIHLNKDDNFRAQYSTWVLPNMAAKGYMV